MFPGSFLLSTRSSRSYITVTTRRSGPTGSSWSPPSPISAWPSPAPLISTSTTSNTKNQSKWVGQSADCLLLKSREATIKSRDISGLFSWELFCISQLTRLRHKWPRLSAMTMTTTLAASEDTFRPGNKETGWAKYCVQWRLCLLVSIRPIGVYYPLLCLETADHQTVFYQ